MYFPKFYVWWIHQWNRTRFMVLQQRYVVSTIYILQYFCFLFNFIYLIIFIIYLIIIYCLIDFTLQIQANNRSAIVRVLGINDKNIWDKIKYTKDNSEGIIQIPPCIHTYLFPIETIEKQETLCKLKSQSPKQCAKYEWEMPIANKIKQKYVHTPQSYCFEGIEAIRQSITYFFSIPRIITNNCLISIPLIYTQNHEIISLNTKIDKITSTTQDSKLFLWEGCRTVDIFDKDKFFISSNSLKTPNPYTMLGYVNQFPYGIEPTNYAIELKTAQLVILSVTFDDIDDNDIEAYKTLYVVNDKTEYILDGSINSRVPQSIYTFGNMVYLPNYISTIYNTDITTTNSIDNTNNTNSIKKKLLQTSYIQKILKECQKMLKPYFFFKKNMEINPINIQPSQLLEGPHNSGKRMLVQEQANILSCNVLEINMAHIFTTITTIEDLQSSFELITNQIQQYRPCIAHLRNIHQLEMFFTTMPRYTSVLQSPIITKDNIIDSNTVTPSTLLQTLQKRQYINNKYDDYNKCIILIASYDTSQNTILKNNIKNIFSYSIKLPSITIEEQHDICKDILTSIDIKIQNIQTFITKQSSKTIGIYLWDIQDILKKFYISYINNDDTIVMDGIINDTIKYTMQRQYGTTSTIVNIPHIQWDDIGGQDNVKKLLQNILRKKKNILKIGQKSTGIQLYGPPGTGKTLLAKAVATECGMNFLSVKGPEQLSMYVGESERNVRNIFQRAKKILPCVLFFDEFDSLAPSKGLNNSHGVMDRIVSQLITEIDSIHSDISRSQLFLIGATNRIDLLDISLLRPGRFDHCIYLGIPNDTKSKLSILKSLTRKFTFDIDVDLEQVILKCPSTLTGADIFALASDAMLFAITDRINYIQSMYDKDIKNDNNISSFTVAEYISTLSPELIQILVKQDHFITAAQKIVPSLSQQEIEYYNAKQRSFQSSRSLPVNNDCIVDTG